MRPEGWEALLAEHVEQASKPFEWGRHDCVLWTADWVRKITGDDHAADFRGLYSSEAEASRLLNRLGLENPEAAADAHLEAINPKRARRGDLLLHPGGMLGICYGRVGVFITESGMTTVATLCCPKAWKVG